MARPRSPLELVCRWRGRRSPAGWAMEAVLLLGQPKLLQRYGRLCQHGWDPHCQRPGSMEIVQEVSKSLSSWLCSSLSQTSCTLRDGVGAVHVSNNRQLPLTAGPSSNEQNQSCTAGQTCTLGPFVGEGLASGDQAHGSYSFSHWLPIHLSYHESAGAAGSFVLLRAGLVPAPCLVVWALRSGQLQSFKKQECCFTSGSQAAASHFHLTSKPKQGSAKSAGCTVCFRSKLMNRALGRQRDSNHCRTWGLPLSWAASHRHLLQKAGDLCRFALPAVEALDGSFSLAATGTETGFTRRGGIWKICAWARTAPGRRAVVSIIATRANLTGSL